MIEFRDAIARVQDEHFNGPLLPNGQFPDEFSGADVVLAMPLMVWLQEWARGTQAHLDPTCPPELREWIGGAL